jgi:ribonuclease HII
MRKDPTFEHERQFWQKDIALIAGVDEVGVGALAGPVCAAAVMFKESKKGAVKSGLIIIRDSKQMTEKQREKATVWIKENAMAWAVGEASVEEITKINILRASHLAMKRAVEGLGVRPNMLLVDGRPIELCDDIPTVNLIGGDALSVSIAAASIVAKVHRDDIMRKLDKDFSDYGFASHKGYGAVTHMAALKEFGACPHHRPTYAPVAKVISSKEAQLT